MIHYLTEPSPESTRDFGDAPCGALIDGGITPFTSDASQVTCPRCSESIYDDGVRRLEDPLEAILRILEKAQLSSKDNGSTR